MSVVEPMSSVPYCIQRTFITFGQEQQVDRRRSKSWDGSVRGAWLSGDDDIASESKHTSSTDGPLSTSASDEESMDFTVDTPRSSVAGDICNGEASIALDTESAVSNQLIGTQEAGQSVYVSSGLCSSTPDASQTMYCILPPIKVKLGPDGTPLWDEATTEDALPTWVEAAPPPPAQRHAENVVRIADDARTTIMLRNIPNDYTRDMLAGLLDSQGFQCRYDFIYLPVDFRRWSGFGYAFVNFVTHADAEKCRLHFHGFKQWRMRSAKVCDVCWGEPLQGLAAHIDRYRNSPLMHQMVPDHVRPALYVNGCRVEFPATTKRLRHPRAKQHPARGIKCHRPTPTF